MKQKLLTLSVLSAMSFSSLAADSEAEVKAWDISSEAGAIITSGNTKTTTLKGGIKVKHNLQSWHNEYKLDGIYKEDEVTQDDGTKVNKRTNEKYSLSAQGNYKLSDEGSHLFIYGAYDSDYFGAFRDEAVVSLGYGLTLLSDGTMQLSAEAGPGLKRFTYQDKSPELDGNGNSLAGEADSEVVGVAKLDYSWQISDNARFTQVVAFEYGATNKKTTSESALMAKINGSLQMKVGFNVTHNSDVSDDKKNTDTETSLTLVYSF